MGKILSARGLVKRYAEDVPALNGITFDVEDGDFFVIMGPSGCGKSTLLKIIAGILDYDEGELYIKGKNMKYVPAYKRDVSLMFENFALFPHMNVFDNVAFGLRMLGLDSEEIERRVKKTLELVGMKGLEKRMPIELSGGQRQRVALARSLVIEPAILLLDEPLSHVDYRLQRKFMEDLKEIHKSLGNTFMLTTHVQEHGLSLADTLMIMNSGLIEQIGTPEEIYNAPKTIFAARFVGEINIFSGEVVEADSDACYIKTEIGVLKAVSKDGSKMLGRKLAYAFRPERVKVGKAAEGCEIKYEASLVNYYYFGRHIEYFFDVGNGVKIRASLPSERTAALKLGEKYLIGWDPKDVRLIEKPSVVKGIDIEQVIYGK